MIEDDDPMQDAITMLVTRMENYPEEFTVRSGRFWEVWEQLRLSRAASTEDGTSDPLWFMSPAERERLLLGVRNLLRQVYIQQVMTKLVEPEEIKPTPQQLTAVGHFKTAGLLGTARQTAVEMQTAKEYEAFSRQMQKQQYDAYIRQQNLDDSYNALRNAKIP